MAKERVKRVKDMEYTDGNGEVYQLKDVIVIDLTGTDLLVDLLEQAVSLIEKRK